MISPTYRLDQKNAAAKAACFADNQIMKAKALWIMRLLSCTTLSACLSTSPHHAVDQTAFNLPLTTLGGTQLWADVAWRSGWRVQENVLFGQHRLLDPDDVRRAWGGKGGCLAALDAQAPPRSEPLDHLVVLLHGLGRSRKSMQPLADALAGEGLTTANIGYPSTRRSLEAHATQLNELLDGIGPVERISFVTHSMGGPLVRAALEQQPQWLPDTELFRVVQLGPPSRGSEFARCFHGTPIGWLLGPTLGVVAGDGAAELTTFPCKTIVIAGGKGDGHGWNPWVEGDDDGVVGVSETWSPGAQANVEHRIVRELHTFLMVNAEAQRIVLSALTRP